MTHATLTVALPGTLTKDEIQDALAAVMERYNEERPTPRYVSHTREQLIAKAREDIEDYRRHVYARYLEDPAAYRARRSDNPAHLAYLDGTGENGGFPAKLTWTDDQVHADAIRWEEEDDIGPEGEVYSTRNPDAKWDWYVIGGRWAGYWPVHPQGGEAQALSSPAWQGRMFPLTGSDLEYAQRMDAREGTRVDVARVMDIDFDNPAEINGGHVETFAFLDSEGEWHEKAERWSENTDDAVQAAWKAQYLALIAKESDNTWLVLVDYHT